MMTVKSSSTGKSKVKRIQSIRMTECSTCPKLMQKIIHKKDYEKPQPVKIAQLLGLSENLRSTQKDSVRKRLQPERLGTLSSAKSTNKVNKPNGINAYDESMNNYKCVRRNLNFYELSTNSSKKNYKNKNEQNKFISDESVYKKCSDLTMRKSLLLPPNTIKDKHLEKYNGKIDRCSKMSEIPNQIMLSDKKNTVQLKHKKVKVVNSLPLNDKSNTNNSAVSFNNIKSFSGHKISETSNYSNSKHVVKSHIQHSKISYIVPTSQISSQYTINQQRKNQSIVQNNRPQEVSALNQSNLNIEPSTKSEEGEYIQNLCSNLQTTKLTASENDTNVKDISSKMISNDKIISLICDLKNMVSVTEENVCKLKSMLMLIIQLLSGSDEKITTQNTDMEKEFTQAGKVNNIMIDKGVQVETCYNLIKQSGENVKTPVDGNEPIQNIESNKENYEIMNRRRVSDGDGSFLELENQFNIKYSKSNQNSIFLEKTPVVTRYKQKRSVREYMTLKSTMRFLETPDGKKFRPLHQTDNINNSVLNATYISNKLFTDLHNLYSESPESGA